MSAVTVGRLELSGHVLRGSDGQGAIADTPEHARRLAACWNACDGFETLNIEELDQSGGVLALAKLAEDYKDELAARQLAMIAAAGRNATLSAELAAARAEVGRLTDLLLAVQSHGLQEHEGGADLELDERISAFLIGTRQLTTPDAAVRDAAWKATRLAADLGQVLTISQIPRLPLAMGNYDTVVTVRESRAVYGPRLAADAAVSMAVLNDTDPFNDPEADAAAVAKSIARHAAKTGGAA